MVRPLKCPIHNTIESVRTEGYKKGKLINHTEFQNDERHLFRLEMYCSQCPKKIVKIWHYGSYCNALNRITMKWNQQVLEIRHKGSP